MIDAGRPMGHVAGCSGVLNAEGRGNRRRGDVYAERYQSTLIVGYTVKPAAVADRGIESKSRIRRGMATRYQMSTGRSQLSTSICRLLLWLSLRSRADLQQLPHLEEYTT